MPIERAVARYLTPPAIAERLGVAEETVRSWITSGELIGSNVARRGCRRPRFRVAPEDLEAFLAARRPDAPPSPRRLGDRRREAGVIEFY